MPITHLTEKTENKTIIRGMLGAEIDFIILEYDNISNIAIASRIDAMQLRSEIEIPKLKENDKIKVRIVAVGIKHIIVDMYGKEVIISANNLKHTFIVDCKKIYKVGSYLQVIVKKIDIKNNEYNLSAKDLEENPDKNIRKYITEGGEYVGKVVAFPKQRSEILVQLDNNEITCLCRVPAIFNNYPHYMEKVLVRIIDIKEKKQFIYAQLSRII